MIETTDKRGNTTPCKYRRRNPERFLRRKIRIIRLSGLQNSPQFAVGKKHQHIAVHFIMSRSRQNVAESLLPIQIGAEHPGRSHVLTDGQTACFRGLVGTHKPVAGSEPTRQAEISYAVFCLKKKTVPLSCYSSHIVSRRPTNDLSEHPIHEHKRQTAIT